MHSFIFLPQRFVMEAVGDDPAKDLEGSQAVLDAVVPPAGLSALADFIANVSDDDAVVIDEEQIELVESGVIDLSQEINEADSPTVRLLCPRSSPLCAHVLLGTLRADLALKDGSIVSKCLCVKHADKSLATADLCSLFKKVCLTYEISYSPAPGNGTFGYY